MKVRFRHRILFTFGLSTLAFALTAAGIGTRVSDAGSEEANITRLTARLLESSQFSHHRLDDELAAKFLDRYLDTLDSAHLLFLQSDLDNFDIFRPQLAQLTRQSGDTRPAHVIFARYLERLNQQVSYVTNLLSSETFDFSGHDQYQLEREHAPRPRNLAEAQHLWRQHVRFEFLQEKLADKKPEEIRTTLSHRYTRFQQTMSKFNSDSVVELYLNALAHVYDPHSDYLGHQQMESLSMEMNLSLFGVGATMRVEDGYCKVSEVMPGGPAARSGLVNPGDRIVAVAQSDGEPVDVMDLPLSQAVELIRGPKGTTVKLTLIPSGADPSTRKTVSLIRDEIKLEDERARARIVDLPRGGNATRRVGVIDLPSFYASMKGAKGGSHESATEDVARLITKLKAEHVQGVILDLRHNGGGSLEEAITLTGLFIRKGPVVQTRDPYGRVDVGGHEEGTVAYDGPLVVLTSRLSASASEILAGALKDYGRALIVGDSSTFGKGTVQEIIPLRPIFERNGLSHLIDPGALKVTIRKFYRPDGASTQMRGVKPDLVLPSLTDVRDIAEAAMKDPLEWDAVSILQHDSLNRVWPYVKFLRAQSTARLSNEADFVWLRAEVEQTRKNLATKSVSLNEAQRRRENMREQARADALMRERLASHKTEPPTYEITVQNSAFPGLPGASNAMMPIVKKSLAAEPTPADDESSFAANIELRETENILADYIDLSAPAAVITQR
ncbi:MAG TPA: carboxy terminal-processing peptidase [Verrucomicrobiae bacterium]|nr:carboxy terminal-processing peptidase [Verrucomicrobiae bacterium]